MGGKSLPKPGLDQEAAAAAVRALQATPLQVADVASKETARHPPPPFITSTLQQDASAKAGLSPSVTMRLAQQLYEGSETPGGEGFKPYPSGHACDRRRCIQLFFLHAGNAVSSCEPGRVTFKWDGWRFQRPMQQTDCDLLWPQGRA